MLPAKPSLANAAGYVSSQSDASGPGASLYGATPPVVSVQERLRNSALPPTPSDSAIGAPTVDGPSGSALSRGGLAGFAGGGLTAPSSSDSTGGFGFAALSSSSAGSAGALDGPRGLSFFFFF